MTTWVTTFVKTRSVYLQRVPTICGSGGHVLLKRLYVYVKELEFLAHVCWENLPNSCKKVKRGLLSIILEHWQAYPRIIYVSFHFTWYLLFIRARHLSYVITGIFLPVRDANDFCSVTPEVTSLWAWRWGAVLYLNEPSHPSVPSSGTINTELHKCSWASLTFLPACPVFLGMS